MEKDTIINMQMAEEDLGMIEVRSDRVDENVAYKIWGVVEKALEKRNIDAPCVSTKKRKGAVIMEFFSAAKETIKKVIVIMMECLHEYTSKGIELEDYLHRTSESLSEWLTGFDVVKPKNSYTQGSVAVG